MQRVLLIDDDVVFDQANFSIDMYFSLVAPSFLCSIEFSPKKSPQVIIFFGPLSDPDMHNILPQEDNTTPMCSPNLDVRKFGVNTIVNVII